MTLQYLSTECPDSNTLVAQASSRAGSSDFGDPRSREAFNVFMTAFRDEVWPTMTEKARRAGIEYIVHTLASRYKVIADRKSYPDICLEKISRPMIVVGPPRSGSTLLHNLLSLDADCIAPEHWNCLEPSPPPALGAPNPERLEEARQRMFTVLEPVPDILTAHPYMIEEGSGALAEDGSDIMNMAFCAQEMWCFYRGETYRRFLLETDHSPALQFHHDFLQHVQWGTEGKRWVLKGSDHMLRMRELVSQYPDAILIWTHRDLAEQLGSLANIQAVLCALSGKAAEGEERERVGRLAIEMQRASIEKAMRAREQIGEGPFVDVSYHNLMADPVGTISRIYERVGMSFTPAYKLAIEEWVDHNNQTKHGTHKYSKNEFGLEAGEINFRFREYLDRFGIGYGIIDGVPSMI
jgi:hypothetical protein